MEWKEISDDNVWTRLDSRFHCVMGATGRPKEGNYVLSFTVGENSMVTVTRVDVTHGCRLIYFCLLLSVYVYKITSGF